MLVVRLHVMRRFFYWVLPVGVALVGLVVFAGGFYSYLRGDIGTPVAPASEARGRAASAPRGVIAPIILGDSLARGTGDESGLGIGGRLADELKRNHIQTRPAVNISVNGAKTADLLAQLGSRNVRTLIAESNVVIISVGGNDLWGMGPGGAGNPRAVMTRNPKAVMDEVLGRIEEIVKIVREANPKARIFLVGLYNPYASLPLGAPLGGLVTQWNARVMERFAGDRNFTVVQTADIFSHRDRLSFDRFHPNDEGYALIARRIADAL